MGSTWQAPKNHGSAIRELLGSIQRTRPDAMRVISAPVSNITSHQEYALLAAEIAS
jgi:hypothetical protein